MWLWSNYQKLNALILAIKLWFESFPIGFFISFSPAPAMAMHWSQSETRIAKVGVSKELRQGHYLNIELEIYLRRKPKKPRSISEFQNSCAKVDIWIWKICQGQNLKSVMMKNTKTVIMLFFELNWKNVWVA